VGILQQPRLSCDHGFSCRSELVRDRFPNEFGPTAIRSRINSVPRMIRRLCRSELVRDRFPNEFGPAAIRSRINSVLPEERTLFAMIRESIPPHRQRLRTCRICSSSMRTWRMICWLRLMSSLASSPSSICRAPPMV